MITKFKLLILAAFLFVSVFSASAADVTAKIIGGTTVSSGAYPFMVAILDTTGGTTDYSQQFCGGTLIDSQWVMTAAHCMVKLKDYTISSNMSKLRVLAGTNTLSTTTISSGTKVSVSAVYVHESYNSVTFNNDIALIKLSTPLSVDAIDALSSSTYPGFSTDDLATVAGWGTTTSPEPYSYPTDLMEVDVPVVSNATCSGSYSNITSNMLCAGYPEGGKDSCSGDSGGPLFVQDGSNYIVIGVVSNGNGCALAGFYGIYTRVSQYTSWIEGKMSGTPADSETDPGSTPDISDIPTSGSASEIDTNIEDEVYYNLSGSQLMGFGVVGSTFLSQTVHNESASINNYNIFASIDFTSTLTVGNSSIVALYLPGMDISKVNLFKCEDNMINCSSISVQRDSNEHLIWYYVEDGGTYDTDGLVNGVIVDPVYVGLSTDNNSSSGGGGGGGCSASRDGSPVALILMFVVGGIYLIRRRRA
ncbi:serine protease [Seleniivibrio sp.]|uniref:S1 family peptidase n=1 Tax=Seleniivibrio sp. TaxID=2898801 RepID=UPI0025FF35FB|nr:serine protease [Seleniivibrio sp.]MCD8553115.1 serine protease [Seleniivibrio sp.]